MKAFYSTAYGGPEVSHYGDFPDPSAGNGELLVEVKAVSLNPVDYKVKKGVARLMSGSKFPRIFGSDFAGVVREAGNGVTKFKPGDRVYGVTPVIWGKPGALAQLLAVDQKFVTAIPGQISFDEAASLPIAALTALNGLRKCRVSEGKAVLINGGTGGVGHFAIQIAKAKGAVVTATCSQGNAELARKLGADDTMGYSREELAKTGKKFDAIFDAYGMMDLEDVCRLLKRGGVYATTQIKPFLFLSSLPVQLVYGKKLTSSNVRSKPEDMEEMEKLFLDKKLYPVIENYFSLNHSAEAFELAEHGKPRGKIIIRI
ncbi:MAG: NAD(P)-dependent alcohol dehydrogenase [Bacteroidales bacterium]|jgi:NADPH:quinone reductase-like Zn-dependent oxidoreductase|nr:NAD(P)-dependent alcohol dehydrogenase [Bacteroidales bacterium]